jgi:hypothetical protein
MNLRFAPIIDLCRSICRNMVHALGVQRLDRVKSTTRSRSPSPMLMRDGTVVVCPPSKGGTDSRVSSEVAWTRPGPHIQEAAGRTAVIGTLTNASSVWGLVLLVGTAHSSWASVSACATCCADFYGS